jgi:hypothetical protein
MSKEAPGGIRRKGACFSPVENLGVESTEPTIPSGAKRHRSRQPMPSLGAPRPQPY